MVGAIVKPVGGMFELISRTGQGLLSGTGLRRVRANRGPLFCHVPITEWLNGECVPCCAGDHLPDEDGLILVGRPLSRLRKGGFLRRAFQTAFVRASSTSGAFFASRTVTLGLFGPHVLAQNRRQRLWRRLCGSS